jgi:hypothetical protein
MMPPLPHPLPHYPSLAKLAQKLPPFLSLIIIHMCWRQELHGCLTNYACALGDPSVQGRHTGELMKRVPREVTYS